MHLETYARILLSVRIGADRFLGVRLDLLRSARLRSRKPDQGITGDDSLELAWNYALRRR